MLKTKAIYYANSDTGGYVWYNLFENGESLEKFYGGDRVDYSYYHSAEPDEWQLVGYSFRFRSKLRHITVDDLPKYEPYKYEPEEDDEITAVVVTSVNDDEDVIEEYEPDDYVDRWTFVEEFLESQDAFVPALGSRWRNLEGQRVILTIPGCDPEHIERMDFIAVT